FYAAGNPHFKDAADYLARYTAALPVAPVGEKTGPIEPWTLGGLQGRRFERALSSFALLAPPKAD
ncbi:MAG: hypothetical protein HY928_04345, partial [Elusimicrobia bacterium]|nr:hypothetical protein [Elusimicrobiota bacterium]